MNKYDNTVKEWTAMLTYVSGEHKGTIKALSKANNIDYNRCIRINKTLNKKANKIAYAKSMIEKYVKLRDLEAVVELSLPPNLDITPIMDVPSPSPSPSPSPIEVSSPLPINLNDQTPFSFELNNAIIEESPEYVLKKDFDAYKVIINETIDSLLELQHYSDNIMIFFITLIFVINIIFFILD